VNLKRFLEKIYLFFTMICIRDTALDWTHQLARLITMKSYTLGAEVRVDHINVIALRDRAVGTLRLTCPTVNAVIGN
jgi:hypothetical protein